VRIPNTLSLAPRLRCGAIMGVENQSTRGDPLETRDSYAGAAKFESLLRRSEAAWPELDVERASFIEWLRAELPTIGVPTLDKSHATDLFLAFGCIQGSPAALRAFDVHLLSQVARYIAPVHASASLADDVRQELRERLFLADGDKLPRIATYRGQGPLGAWIRAAAIRTALNLLRQGGRVPAARAEDVGLSCGDPEIDYVRATYADEFRAALESVVASRQPQDRDLLRLHYLDQLNIEEVGARLGVHRATIARRLLRVRETILRETCARLRLRLGLDEQELGTLLALAREDATVSFARILINSNDKQK
jgi:RNA polymerase sigma-70 factor, ECF subfamily